MRNKLGRKLWCGLVATVTLVGVTTSGTVSAHGGGERPTLAQILLADSSRDDADGFDRNWFDYDIVTQALLLFPDLVAAASDPAAQLTAFLPNDRAFRRLVHDLTGTWPRTEQDTFDAVAGLGVDTVKTVLTYHIVAGPPISYRAALQSNGAELTTLQGATIGVQVQRFFLLHYVQLVDKDPDARDPIVIQPQVGGQASNGYAHGIDQVLRPIDL
jgi:uncharacterized surface protein with fasciclin (FAS1) repeats